MLASNPGIGLSADLMKSGRKDLFNSSAIANTRSMSRTSPGVARREVVALLSGSAPSGTPSRRLTAKVTSNATTSATIRMTATSSARSSNRDRT